ncbi:MAG: ATP-binding cassette domain-containing protein [Nitriliruptorales bacterium]|nr:ATP-binding cassette domain-containing protein [Nitriliruptorales bacterium]
MASIHLSHVSFSHSTAQPVVTDVDLDLGPGWHGVVGPNGAGKTTLLRLIDGTLTPTRGTIDRVGIGVVATVPQLTHDAPPRLAEFAARWDGHAAQIRSRLGLESDGLDRWPTLSSGERSRWAIAAALAHEPDLLLLDEPTNHLDADARELLVSALHRYEGIGIVVSHDRSLLDSLTTTTLRVHRGSVEAWGDSYSGARREWQRRQQSLREAHARSRREERRLRADMNRARQAAAGAERGASEARRTASHRDHDAHSTARKERAANAAAAHSQRAGAAARRLERQRRHTNELGVQRQVGGPVSFRDRVSARDSIIELQREDLRVGGTTVLRDLDLHVTPTDRIHIRGANGSGKTTLLGALLDRCTLSDDEVVYLPQELDQSHTTELMGRLRRFDPDRRGRVLGIVANLGVDPDRLLTTERPSPGQARKLSLALALEGTAALVALDEPTNHLDLPAIERLEEALDHYRGAMLLVTHDDPLAERVTDRTWHVADGGVTGTA